MPAYGMPASVSSPRAAWDAHTVAGFCPLGPLSYINKRFDLDCFIWIPNSLDSLTNLQMNPHMNPFQIFLCYLERSKQIIRLSSYS